MQDQSILDLTVRLTQALDQNYDVTDMDAVLDIISILERSTITKEQLETTRLAKYINQLRRRTKSDPLARRSKNLLKKWREMVGIQQPQQATQPQNIQTDLPLTTSISQVESQIHSMPTSPYVQKISNSQYPGHNLTTNINRSLSQQQLNNTGINKLGPVSGKDRKSSSCSSTPIQITERANFFTYSKKSKKNLTNGDLNEHEGNGRNNKVKQPTSFTNLITPVADNNDTSYLSPSNTAFTRSNELQTRSQESIPLSHKSKTSTSSIFPKNRQSPSMTSEIIVEQHSNSSINFGNLNSNVNVFPLLHSDNSSHLLLNGITGDDSFSEPPFNPSTAVNLNDTNSNSNLLLGSLDIQSSELFPPNSLEKHHSSSIDNRKSKKSKKGKKRRGVAGTLTVENPSGIQSNSQLAKSLTTSVQNDNSASFTEFPIQDSLSQSNSSLGVYPSTKRSNTNLLSNTSTIFNNNSTINTTAINKMSAKVGSGVESAISSVSAKSYISEHQKTDLTFAGKFSNCSLSTTGVASELIRITPPMNFSDDLGGGSRNSAKIPILAVTSLISNNSVVPESRSCSPFTLIDDITFDDTSSSHISHQEVNEVIDVVTADSESGVNIDELRQQAIFNNVHQLQQQNQNKQIYPLKSSLSASTLSSSLVPLPILSESVAGSTSITLMEEPKIQKKRGRKKGSKGVDKVLAQSNTFINSQLFENSKLLSVASLGGCKKVKTTKELLADIQNRKIGSSATSSPILIQSRPTSACSESSLPSPCISTDACSTNATMSTVARSTPDKTLPTNRLTDDVDSASESNLTAPTILNSVRKNKKFVQSFPEDSPISTQMLQTEILVKSHTEANHSSSIEEEINKLTLMLPFIDTTKIDTEIYEDYQCYCTIKEMAEETPEELQMLLSDNPSNIQFINGNASEDENSKPVISVEFVPRKNDLKRFDQSSQLMKRMTTDLIPRKQQVIKSIFDIDFDEADDPLHLYVEAARSAKINEKEVSLSSLQLPNHNELQYSNLLQATGNQDQLKQEHKHESERKCEQNQEQVQNQDKVQDQDQTSQEEEQDHTDQEQEQVRNQEQEHNNDHEREHNEDIEHKHEGVEHKHEGVGNKHANEIKNRNGNKNKQKPDQEQEENFHLVQSQYQHQIDQSVITMPTSLSAPMLPKFEIIEDPNCPAKQRYEIQTKQITQFHIEALHNCFIPNINGNWDHSNISLNQLLFDVNSVQLQPNENEFTKDGLYVRVVPQYDHFNMDKLPKDLSHVKFTENYKPKSRRYFKRMEQRKKLFLGVLCSDNCDIRKSTFKKHRKCTKIKKNKSKSKNHALKNEMHVIDKVETLDVRDEIKMSPLKTKIELSNLGEEEEKKFNNSCNTNVNDESKCTVSDNSLVVKSIDSIVLLNKNNQSSFSSNGCVLTDIVGKTSNNIRSSLMKSEQPINMKTQSEEGLDFEMTSNYSISLVADNDISNDHVEQKSGEEIDQDNNKEFCVSPSWCWPPNKSTNIYINQESTDTKAFEKDTLKLEYESAASNTGNGDTQLKIDGNLDLLSNSKSNNVDIGNTVMIVRGSNNNNDLNTDDFNISRRSSTCSNSSLKQNQMSINLKLRRRRLQQQKLNQLKSSEDGSERNQNLLPKSSKDGEASGISLKRESSNIDIDHHHQIKRIKIVNGEWNINDVNHLQKDKSEDSQHLHDLTDTENVTDEDPIDEMIIDNEEDDLDEDDAEETYDEDEDNDIDEEDDEEENYDDEEDDDDDGGCFHEVVTHDMTSTTGNKHIVLTIKKAPNKLNSPSSLSMSPVPSASITPSTTMVLNSQPELTTVDGFNLPETPLTDSTLAPIKLRLIKQNQTRVNDDNDNKEHYDENKENRLKIIESTDDKELTHKINNSSNNSEILLSNNLSPTLTTSFTCDNFPVASNDPCYQIPPSNDNSVNLPRDSVQLVIEKSSNGHVCGGQVKALELVIKSSDGLNKINNVSDLMSIRHKKKKKNSIKENVKNRKTHHKLFFPYELQLINGEKVFNYSSSSDSSFHVNSSSSSCDENDEQNKLHKTKQTKRKIKKKHCLSSSFSICSSTTSSLSLTSSASSSSSISSSSSSSSASSDEDNAYTSAFSSSKFGTGFVNENELPVVNNHQLESFNYIDFPFPSEQTDIETKSDDIKLQIVDKTNACKIDLDQCNVGSKDHLSWNNTLNINNDDYSRSVNNISHIVRNNEYRTGLRKVDEDVDDEEGNNCGKLQQFKEWHEVVQVRSFNDELLTILPYVVID